MEINKYVRLEIIKEAAILNQSLIFTGTYTKEGEGDDIDIRNIIKTVEDYNGKVCFVQLNCSKDELLRRVSKESRLIYRKLLDPDILDKLLNEEDFWSEIPFVKSLKIDNTNLSEEEVAKIIKEKYRL